MRRGTVFIVIFALLAGAIVALTQVFRAQPALEVTVAVDPLAERWIRDAAASFNARGETVGVGRRVRVVVVAIGDMTVFNGQAGWRAEQHPDGWIPAWSALFSGGSVGAGVTARPLSGSLARTTLVWMSPQASTAVDAVTWDGVRAAVTQGNHRIALPAVTSVQGFAGLMSGVAHYHGRNELDAADFGDDVRAYLEPLVRAVPAYATVGPDPALAMSGPTGSTYVAGLATESQWLEQMAVLAAKQPRLGYPDSLVILDFPFYLLDSPNQTDDERAGVQAFAAYLNTPDQQANAMTFGLRPATSEPPAEHPVFARGAAYGAAPALSALRAVDLPAGGQSSIQSFIRWAGGLQR